MSSISDFFLFFTDPNGNGFIVMALSLQVMNHDDIRQSQDFTAVVYRAKSLQVHSLTDRIPFYMRSVLNCLSL